MEQSVSKKSEKSSENSEMPTVEFVSSALRERVAPPAIGSVKRRIGHAARQLGWSYSRTRDAWYADPRIAFRHEEITRVERVSGLTYGREELKEIDAYIAKAEALLHGSDEDFHRPFIAAVRAFFGALDRS